MQITVNGQPKDYTGPATIIALLEFLGINPKSVVVERNLRIIPRDALPQEPLEEGDTIEIIRFVGGG